MNEDEEARKLGIPQELINAEHFRKKTQLDEALRWVNVYLNDHYEHYESIMMIGHIMGDAQRFGFAQAIFKLCTLLRPEDSLAWANLGLCYQEGQNLVEGEKCFRKALELNPNNSIALNNMSQLYVNLAEPQKAVYVADKCIRIEPELPDAHYNRSLAMLQMGNWQEGWKGYDHNLGKLNSRKERFYGMIPRWTGVEGMTLIAYGEQGLGDEISFASCIPDLMKKNKVFIDCDHRLAGLFKRSFDCKVFGTRYKGDDTWHENYDIDASVAMGSIPGFYRKKDEDFPGTPYLVADPQRRLMYRSLLDSLGTKKKIGISWAGGIKNTAAARRSMPLADMLPILRQDATFISLQYRDAQDIKTLEEKAGIKVHHWPFAVHSIDYDDTAALVAELDLVITVTQSVVHLAGALGVPCWVLVPERPMWRYRLKGDGFLWANSVKLYRQKGEWVHCVNKIAYDLRDWLNQNSKRIKFA